MSLLSDIAIAIKTKLGGTSTNNTIPRYDGTTCTLKKSNVTISDTDVVTAGGGFVGNLTGTASNATLAASATKLETARTINGVSFNGTANITIADSTKAPLTGGGTSGTWDISITGNASTANNAALAANATKLATARFINGVSFDGTSNITVADSTKAPLNGTGATGTWGINITGNAATATKLSTTRTNYKNFTDSVVVGELMWKNYGNGHTIFDASNSTTPTGVAINNINPDVPWSPAHPTLMGYSGYDTFGVRVDSSRYADQLKTARTINGVAFDGTANITVSDATAVKLTGDQTIAGVKTFSSSPIVPTPTANTQAANKQYVDSKTLNISPLPDKPTPVNTDNLALQETGGLLKKLSFANLMAWIKSFSFGWGQTWQDVTASRSAGVTYTNNTNKPIEFNCSFSLGGNWSFTTKVDGIISGSGIFGSITIPVGSTYSYTWSGGIFDIKIRELR